MSIAERVNTGTQETRLNKAHSAPAAGIAIILCALLAACGDGSGSGSGSSSGGTSSSSGGGSGSSSGGSSSSSSGGSSSGGGTPTYTVGGTTSGLAGSGLTLRDNGTDDLLISNNGAFTFHTALAGASSYSVTIAKQPSSPTQNCTVANASGTVGSANVTNITVSCVTVPLTLASSVPTSGAANVARTANLVLTFSAPLDASTVSTGNVSLKGPSGTAAVTVAASNNVLTVTPTNALLPNASYTLTVSTAVHGTGGEALASAVTLAFSTASIPWTPLISRTWTMPAGTQGYKCTRALVPNDVYITGFRISAPDVVRAMVTVSSSAPQMGDYDCTSGSVDTFLIYASGPGTGDFVFPAGFGIHVKAGQYINLNLHIFNQDAAPSTDTAQILVQAGLATDVTTFAEMLRAGTYNINIANDGAVHTATGGFNPAYDQQVLALLPLMHTHAIHQTVTLNTQTLLDVDFDPTKQPFYPLSAVSIHVTDTVEVVCSYINTGTTTLTYGNTWDDTEQCFTAMYVAPSAGQSFDIASN